MLGVSSMMRQKVFTMKSCTCGLLFFTFRSISGALYTYFEAATVTMIIYFVLTFVCSRLLSWAESKMDGPSNFDLATTDMLAFTSGMTKYDERKGGTH